MLSDFAYRVRAIFRRRALNNELDEELRDHIERETEKYLRAGMSGEEARRNALIAIGGIEQARQRTRESRGTGAPSNICGRICATACVPWARTAASPSFLFSLWASASAPAPLSSA
jgi:hypothetical protein